MDYILSIDLFTPRFLSESAFDFAVLSIELGDNIGSVLPWQQLPKNIRKQTNNKSFLLHASYKLTLPLPSHLQHLINPVAKQLWQG